MKFLKTMCIMALAGMCLFVKAEVITVILPFPSGGVTDRIWRTLEPELNQALQPHSLKVVTEYIFGNGGAIAAARAATPGVNKLLFTSSSLAISMVNNPAVTYGPADFTVLGYFGTMPMFVAVAETGPKNLSEFVTRCRTGSMTYATPGVGSGNHLSAVAFLRQQGCSATAVPYKSQIAGLPDVAGGRVDFVLDFETSATAEMVRQGRLRNIHSLTDLNIKNWHVLVAPRDYNHEQLRLVQQALQRVLENTTAQQQFQQLGLTEVGRPVPRDFLEQQRQIFERTYREITR